MLQDWNYHLAVAAIAAIQHGQGKVERQVGKSVAALLLGSRVGEQFDAIITGASPKGTWARVFQPPVEGKLVQGIEGVKVGDLLHVRLVRADVEQGFIDFQRVQASAP